MLSSGGDQGNRIYYKARNRWAIDADNVEIVEVNKNGMSVTGDVTVDGDLNTTGGMVMPLVFAKGNVLQDTFSSMTASFLSSTTDPTTQAFDGVPMVRSGSVLGISLATMYDAEIVKSGALTASVMVDNANVACTVAVHTGTRGTAFATNFVTTVAKDTTGLTFKPGQFIGVSLTSSAEYLSEPDITSASFIATVLVEQ